MNKYHVATFHKIINQTYRVLNLLLWLMKRVFYDFVNVACMGLFHAIFRAYMYTFVNLSLFD